MSIRFESMNKVSTDNADTPSVLYSSRRRLTSRRHMSDDVFLRQGVESNALLSLSLSVDTLDSKNNVSTDNADTSSAVVKLAEEIDESAPHVR